MSTEGKLERVCDRCGARSGIHVETAVLSGWGRVIGSHEARHGAFEVRSRVFDYCGTCVYVVARMLSNPKSKTRALGREMLFGEPPFDPKTGGSWGADDTSQPSAESVSAETTAESENEQKGSGCQ